jgi:NurA-like 5'-3' nuclease
VEIARVEIPAWIANDEETVKFIHSVIIDQIKKGDGYPVVLSEAHEKAVVRAQERELFYRMLEESFVKNNISVRISRKSFKKRTPTV